MTTAPSAKHHREFHQQYLVVYAAKCPDSFRRWKAAEMAHRAKAQTMLVVSAHYFPTLSRPHISHQAPAAASSGSSGGGGDDGSRDEIVEPSVPFICGGSDAPDLTQRAAEAQIFCNTLWPLCDAYVEIRAKRGQDIARRMFHRRRLPPFAKMLANLHDWNIWVGVALRRADGDGGRANCALIYTVHLDADLKDAARAAIFAELLERFPLQPTLVVASGSPHSFHVYWRLKEPLVLQDAEGKIRPDVEESYRRAVVGLAEHFGGDPSVADLPRVMRLPGSRNVKPSNGGTPVRIVRRDPLHRYNLADFEPWAAPPAPVANVPSREAGCSAGGSRVSEADAVDFWEEFSRRGDVLEDAGSGLYFVRCPWIHEHTSFSGISETAIWRPTVEGDGWGFKCLHAHCARRRTAHVYEYFRLMRAADQMSGSPAEA